jgi:hypothetical protein
MNATSIMRDTLAWIVTESNVTCLKKNVFNYGNNSKLGKRQSIGVFLDANSYLACESLTKKVNSQNQIKFSILFFTITHFVITNFTEIINILSLQNNNMETI